VLRVTPSTAFQQPGEAVLRLGMPPRPRGGTMRTAASSRATPRPSKWKKPSQVWARHVAGLRRLAEPGRRLGVVSRDASSVAIASARR
jgi:hypothetical protein